MNYFYTTMSNITFNRAFHALEVLTLLLVNRLLEPEDSLKSINELAITDSALGANEILSSKFHSSCQLLFHGLDQVHVKDIGIKEFLQLMTISV